MASSADLEAQQTLLTPERPQHPQQPSSTSAFATMAALRIPIDAITSRMNLSGRFEGLGNQSISSRFANLRPISEFFDIKRISKPANFSEVQSRVNYNLGYFSSNYAVVFTMLAIYSLLSNPTLLFVIFLVIGGMYGIGKLQGNDLEIGSWRATTSQLYTTLLVVAIPLGFIASPFYTALWLIGASQADRVSFFRGGGLGGRPRTPYTVPQWGRPSGAKAGVGRYMEEAEDVYKYQEVDTDDEKNGGFALEPGYRTSNHGRVNPDDELYFNDMDLRAWERRTGAVDGYGDDDSFEEDEGYYDGTASVSVITPENEEEIFQIVMGKIRQARSAGGSDIQLTPEELEVYQSRVMHQRASVAQPQQQQQVQARHGSIPMQNSPGGVIGNNSSNTVPSVPVAASVSGSTRSSKEKRRTSIFGSRPKKDKEKSSSSSSRKRSTSNATEFSQPPPGFVVPGVDGQHTLAPINAYSPRRTREPGLKSSRIHRPSSRSASLYSQQAQVSTRTPPPREIPGAFPSSPQGYHRVTTPLVQQTRPPSSSSHSSISDYVDRPSPPHARTDSSSTQPPAKLIPFPVLDYQHHTADPYQYHVPGQPAPYQYPVYSPPHPQYARQVPSPVESYPSAMPRHVPVPGQYTAAPTSFPQGGYTDPSLDNRATPVYAETVREDGQGGLIVDLAPHADATGHKSSGKDGERKRRTVKTKKKT
ncbi:PRA1 family protein-domain-containing protein [Dendryphion nanum]|uniref:PRA1 family protein-domain-containing protein n=1 Tax=Dendryphion nanum TaxID=256645 RepID=A0A9P9E6M1_9PLEO|nr:PRA1 family protein-domain-containing protein [Dendryphion nanum]